MKIKINEHFIFIDKEDLIYLNSGFRIEKRTRTFYVRCNRKLYGEKRLHQLILNCPKNKQIDHINGNGLDNRKINLRVCTTSENQKNRKKLSNNTSGYKGVTLHRQTKKWGAQIINNGHKYWLGLYLTPIEAHKAYCIAAEKLHKEFANVN